MKEIIDQHSGKLFLGTLIVVLFVLGFHNYLTLDPVGPHFIRQVDSFAFVDYYQNHGFNFFETGGWYLGDSNGKTASEFPILYYLTALIGFLVGYEHVILRLFTLLIVSLGFYHLFLLLKIILKDVVLSLLFTILFLSSTVVLYYSVNFLPDASALGLVLSGWYFGLRNILNDKEARIDKAFMFFLLAGLLKITFLIHPIALVFSLFILNWKKEGSITLGFKVSLRVVLSLIIVFAIVFGWFGYAKFYNEFNNSKIFLTGITPIWDLTSSAISRTWLAIHHDWFSSYYYQTSFHVFLGISVLGIASSKFIKIDVFGIATIILGLGNLCYIFLFFKQFKDHDYYMLNCAPFVFFIVIHSFLNLQNRFSYVFQHWIVSVGILLITVLSLNYASRKLNERFTTVSPLFEKNNKSLKGIEDYLSEINIPKDATFIVLSDETINGPFYFMKRHGWTVPSEDAHKNVEAFKYRNEADYILITPDNPLAKNSDRELIGEYKGLKIYK